VEIDLVKRLDKLFDSYHEVGNNKDIGELSAQIEDIKRDIEKIYNEIANIKQLLKYRKQKSKKMRFINSLRDRLKSVKHLIKVGEGEYFIDKNGFLRDYHDSKKLSFHEAKSIFNLLYDNEEKVYDFISFT